MKEEQNAFNALNFIIPILKRYKFNWIITGGFACYVYGVNRPITDIDIDIETNKDSKEFKKFINEIKPFVSQKLTHFKDEFYDNYSIELNYIGQIIDICPSDNLKIFNKETSKYEKLYALLDGFPKPIYVKFKDLKLPLLSRELLILNKEMIKRDKWDIRDIEELKKL